MNLYSAIGNLGAGPQRKTSGLGAAAVFALRVFAALLRPPFRLRRFIYELYDVGVLSLPIVISSAVVVGAVLGLQLHIVLTNFGAEASLGQVIGLVLLRELGPVLTGLLVTGRAGSAMAAEIGVMNATEQLDGMRTMAMDPLHYVVAPKALAMLFCLPLLASLFVVFAIGGAWLVAVELRGMDSGLFFSGLQSIVFDVDVVGSLIKDVVFAAIIAVTATYRGFTSGRSAAEVSGATTATVVTASVSILVADFIVTALWGF